MHKKLMNYTAIVAIWTALILAASTAHSQPLDAGPTIDAALMIDAGAALPISTPTAETQPLELARWAWDAATGDAPGKAWLVLGALLILATSMARKIPKVGDWLKATDTRSVLLAFGLSFAGSWGTALLASASWSTDAALAALGIGVAATGGYAVLWKRLALPLLRKVPAVGDWLPAAPDEKKAPS
jgi:hypothetical protein